MKKYRKVKYTSRKSCQRDKTAAVSPVKMIGLILAGYGFLVLSSPSEYAQWVTLENAPILGLFLIIIGVIMAMRG